MEATNQQQEVKSKSFRQLYKEGHIKTVKDLAINQSQYPFITVLNQKGRAQNLYFSKNSSKIIMDTFNVGDNVLEVLKEAEIVQTTNEQGENRFKISISNNSRYASQSAMQEVFGESDEIQSNFDTELFVKEYYRSNLVETEQKQEESVASNS